MQRTPSLSQLFKRPWFIVAILLSLGLVFAIPTILGVDFQVYREGAKVLFAAPGERSLYDPMPQELGTRGLPFTYPPFAALLFVPFAHMSVGLGLLLLSLTTGACLVITSVIVARYLQRHLISARFKTSASWLFGTIVAASALIGLSGPWRETIDFGQINAILMMLVVIDLLRPAGKIPRGFLIGIAAGIKLTPLAFGLLFLARKDWKAVLCMGAGFVGSIAVGWAAAPAESLNFWTSLSGSSARVGDSTGMYNMSLSALLDHLGLQGTAHSVAWLVGCVAIIGLGFLAIRRAEERSDTIRAVASNAIVMLMISPVSWFHHWVWIALIIPATWVHASAGGRRIRRWGRSLAVLMYPASILSSYAVTILFTGAIADHGPLGWALLSDSSMLLSFVALCLWAAPRSDSPVLRSHESLSRET